MYRPSRYVAARFDRLEVRLHRMEKTLQAICARPYPTSSGKRQRKAYSESSADQDAEMRTGGTSVSMDGLSSDADKREYALGPHPRACDRSSHYHRHNENSTAPTR